MREVINLWRPHTTPLPIVMSVTRLCHGQSTSSEKEKAPTNANVSLHSNLIFSLVREQDNDIMSQIYRDFFSSPSMITLTTKFFHISINA